MDRSKGLAELLGILLGDGNLNKINNCITIVGSIEDKQYYEKHVIPLIKSLFDVNPRLRKRKDRNALYVDFSSKKVMEYLSKDLGLVRGNKVNATVPAIIKKNPKLIPHFLRGLFDTDGCLKFTKQNKNKNYYPRLQFCFRDTKFSSEIIKLLEDLNFNIGVWKEKRFNGLHFYQISGNANLEKWMSNINMNNPVHKTKYLFWKKYGFYVSRASLKSRIEALNLNTKI